SVSPGFDTRTQPARILGRLYGADKCLWEPVWIPRPPVGEVVSVARRSHLAGGQATPCQLSGQRARELVAGRIGVAADYDRSTVGHGGHVVGDRRGQARTTNDDDVVSDRACGQTVARPFGDNNFRPAGDARQPTDLCPGCPVGRLRTEPAHLRRRVKGARLKTARYAVFIAERYDEAWPAAEIVGVAEPEAHRIIGRETEPVFGIGQREVRRRVGPQAFGVAAQLRL